MRQKSLGKAGVRDSGAYTHGYTFAAPAALLVGAFTSG
jgi:hypothetical protein